MVDLIAENDEDMRELLDFLHGECPIFTGHVEHRIG